MQRAFDHTHAEGQGRLGDIGQHLGEERTVLFFAHAQAGLGDEVAERQWRGQVLLLSVQMRLHFLDHQFQRGVVHHQVMILQAEQPASVWCSVGQMRAQ